MSRAPASQERRAFGRRESCIHAVLHVAGRPPLHCIVRNYSEGGALLELPEEVATTQPVRLIIGTHRLDTMCEVRHARGAMMGIRFYSAVEVDALIAASNPRPAARPAEPVTGTQLRRKLFGSDAPVLVREYKSYAAGFLRES